MNRNFNLIVLSSFITLFSLFSCNSKENEKTAAVNDFKNILKKGELNILTLYGSTSYFIYKGEAKGYEYELINQFAQDYNLKLNIILGNNETQLSQMLLEGKGDLIAYNIPISNEGKEKLIYTGREIINHQVLVQRSDIKENILKDVTELIGKEITVINNSKYHKRLINLNNELGGGIPIKTIDKDSVTVEDLIEMVSGGEIDYTVSEGDLAKLNKTYFHNLHISLKISHPQRSSWAVRKTSPELALVINQWMQKSQKTTIYRSITKRYFEMSKLPGDEPAPVLNSDQISLFDNYFKIYAKKINWDWRLLASIAYQESKFHTDRVSWAGAIGLMGIMPGTAEALGFSRNEMIFPEESIQAATQLIKRLNKSFSRIEDELERIKFILAAYNAGSGHIYDAQTLAEKYGKNPLLWIDVEEYLKLKHLPEYYEDPAVKQGYFKSRETVSYVQNVLERWEYYKEKVKNETIQ
ncbi:MAG: transglycosylase SLT domain-containing protein [Dysgonamonadaceae bacterium]|jgi:membrane-bound lytic murein transglycosylase F|nr:transglycosylase SLT domain-containing protein [Dysgonamonadaceae bacterium]